MKRRTALTLLATAPVALSLSIAGRANAAETHVVKIQGFKFLPNELDVKVGDTIEFRQGDNAPHTATARDKSWDTGTLGNGESAQIKVVADMGTSYFCKFHPMMKGTLNITG